MSKGLKLSHDHYSLRDTPTRRASNYSKIPESSLFSLLPAEILEKIFNYLSPLDLLSIGKLGNRNIRNISLRRKCIDFSGCNTVQAKDLSSFFTEDRALHIQEINFNNVFFVTSSILEKCIVKCKHLRKLSVYECGLSYKSLNYIFKSCKELEELYWTVSGPQLKPVFGITFLPVKLKKLYLHLKLRFCLNNFADILEQCATSDEIVVHVCEFLKHMLVSPQRIRILLRSSPLKNDGLRCVVFKSKIFQFTFPYIHNENGLTAVHQFARRMEKFLKGEDFNQFFINDSAYLQVVTKEDQLGVLLSVPANSLTNLVVIMTEEKLCLENHIETLNQIAGEKLQGFAVVNKSLSNIAAEPLSEIQMQYKLITEVTSTCINIEVLDLSGIHFNARFCLKTLCLLKKLKNVSLPACILRRSEVTSVTPENITVGQLFAEFVLQCKNVEKFSLYGCSGCDYGPEEHVLKAIAKWPKLTHLLISRVRTLMVCNFLKDVAESCPDLRSLELIAVSLSVCFYLPSVYRILRKSKQLMFLRINQKSFDPVNNVFWECVSMAQNLQGLCLSTAATTVMPNEMITNALKMLPYIHLFHLQGYMNVSISLTLRTEVKKLMLEKGVKFRRVEIPFSCMCNEEECLAPHFP